jgi:hypothetical protein
MNDTVHRFRLGQSVTLSPGFGFSGAASAVYEVVRLLPSTGAQYQYKIRNSAEMYDRTALENQLQPHREA